MTDKKEYQLPEGAVEIPTQGRFVKWEKHGDAVTGVILRLELSKKYKDKGENFILAMRTDAGERIAVSAPLKIHQAVTDFDLVGKRVHIIYFADTESKGGTVKEFKIGALPPLRTASQEADDPDKDLPF